LSVKMRVDVKVRKLRFKSTYVYFCVYTPETVKIKYRVAFIGSPVCDTLAFNQLCRDMAGKGCLCVSIDLPGFGNSSVMAEQTNAYRAQIIWGILDDVDFGRNEDLGKWHLVSHGSSCGTVLEMTRTQPNSVLSRTLIAPVSHRFGFTSHEYRMSGLRKWFYRQVYNYYIEDRGRFNDKLKTVFGYELPRERADKLYEQFSSPGFLETMIKLLENGFYINEGAFDVKGPLILIYGSRDPFRADTYAMVRALDDPERAHGHRLDQPLENYQRKREYMEVHQLPAGHVPMGDKYKTQQADKDATFNAAIMQFLLGLMMELDGTVKTVKKK
jgi:hypothetical protein